MLNEVVEWFNEEISWFFKINIRSFWCFVLSRSEKKTIVCNIDWMFIRSQHVSKHSKANNTFLLANNTFISAVALILLTAPIFLLVQAVCHKSSRDFSMIGAAILTSVKHRMLLCYLWLSLWRKLLVGCSFNQVKCFSLPNEIFWMYLCGLK